MHGCLSIHRCARWPRFRDIRSSSALTHPALSRHHPPHTQMPIVCQFCLARRNRLEAVKFIARRSPLRLQMLGANEAVILFWQPSCGRRFT